MIEVLQEPELGEDRIAVVNDAVSIAAVFRLVKLGQSKKAVADVGRRLNREVPEQLCAVIDGAVAVPV